MGWASEEVDRNCKLGGAFSGAKTWEIFGYDLLGWSMVYIENHRGGILSE